MLGEAAKNSIDARHDSAQAGSLRAFEPPRVSPQDYPQIVQAMGCGVRGATEQGSQLSPANVVGVWGR